jgi:outer membrane protein
MPRIRQTGISGPILLLALMLISSLMSGAAAQPADPYRLLPAMEPDLAAAGFERACPGAEATPPAPLDLAALVDMALCANPATSAAWAGVRAAAAAEGIARASLAPVVNASVSPSASLTRTWLSGLPARTDSDLAATARLSLDWLLFDGGARRARISAAEASRAAALAAFAEVAQDIVLQVALSYDLLLAAEANLEAARAQTRFSDVSVEAARARERAGLGLRSDTLQAETALGEARLAERRAAGEVLVRRGALAVTLGRPPTLPLAVQPPARATDPAALRESAEALIADAERLRPDLRQRAATLAAAEAQAVAARADRRPTLFLRVGPSAALRSDGPDAISGSVGLTLSVPVLDVRSRYAVAQADSEAARAAALLEQARQSAGLDVWTAFQDLETEAQSLGTARLLLASAEEAARLAQGRYQAGVGTITELLNAQAALAGARRTLVAAEFGLRSARVRLARAVGNVGAAVP